MLVPFIESFNSSRPLPSSRRHDGVLFGTVTTIYLGIGAALPIDNH